VAIEFNCPPRTSCHGFGMLDVGHGPVLIVDDDLVVARSLARQLADLCPVAIADGIEHALELAELEPFVAALVDYHLGSDHGTTLAESLHEDDRLTAIIIMTADHSPAVADEVLGAGHLLVYKPMDPERLRATVALASSSDGMRSRLAAWLVDQGAPHAAAEKAAEILSYRSSAEAARALARSEHTMRDYIRPCLDVTGAQSKTELLQAFLGLIDLSGDEARRS